jgi:hypothetical protein
VEALDARLIHGTDKDSTHPFFSPDGQWIGYFSQSDQKLKKVAISGGAPVVLCDAGSLVAGASWGSDNTIVYCDLSSGIMRVSANGGTPVNLIKRNLANNVKEGPPTYPQMLPDGKTLLFTKIDPATAVSVDQIVVQSLKSGERKILFKGGSNAKYLPTGHIVYFLLNNNVANLFAVPFDLNKLEVSGGPVSILEDFKSFSFAFSESGTLVYVPQPVSAAGAASTASSGNTLVWVDRQGKEEPLGAAPDAYQDLKISPDCNKVALTITSGNTRNIWIWDIPHKTPTKLTFDKANVLNLG